MNAKKDEGGFKPPYISFTTLLNLIQKMADNGTPPRIDRSYLSGSEGTKTQVLAACRSLGLIEGEKNDVTDLLKAMVNNPDHRGAMVKAMLEEHFPEPVRLGTINATQGQLEEAFKTFGISGDTMRKAVAFYLKAAEFSGVPTSANFKTPTIQRADGTATRKTTTKTKNKGEKDASRNGGGSGGGGGGPKIPSVHPGLAGVLEDLPPRGRGWTQDEKDAWTLAFKAMLDYTIPVVDEVEDDEPEVEYEDEPDTDGLDDE